MKRFGIGSLACYDDLEQVGEGTYGFVFRARDKRTNESVALKKLILHKESSGFPLCAVREVKFLKSLAHKNIVKLKDIATSKGAEQLDIGLKSVSLKAIAAVAEKDGTKATDKQQTEATASNPHLRRCGNLYLVFEYVEHDLGGLIDSKYRFPVRAIKSITKQLLEVLEFLSEKRIIHRDIKSSNILISNRHQVKLADFGLARSILSYDGREGTMDLTNNVVTMWYKAPELLLGSHRYTNAVDMWSVGCVLAELELLRPLFPGKSDLEQYDLITKVIGSPTEDSWPGMSALPSYELISKSCTKVATSISTCGLNTKVSTGVIGLLERILVADPSRRATPKNALTNKFFHTAPLPPDNPAEMDSMDLQAGASLHEYQTKQLRRQREEEAKKAVTAASEQEQGESQAQLSSAVTVTVTDMPGAAHSHAGSVSEMQALYRPPPPLFFPPPMTQQYPFQQQQQQQSNTYLSTGQASVTTLNYQQQHQQFYTSSAPVPVHALGGRGPAQILLPSTDPLYQHQQPQYAPPPPPPRQLPRPHPAEDDRDRHKIPRLHQTQAQSSQQHHTGNNHNTYNHQSKPYSHNSTSHSSYR